MRTIDENIGVTQSLVVSINANDADSPFRDLPAIQFDFRLAAATTKDVSGRVGADPSQIVTKLAG